MSSPLVSVVMAVYNGEAFLAEAVESVLTQTQPDFEFVIIDDGSTDRTPFILADYAHHDDRVRVVTQANRGRAESLNRGINLARSALIARIDADDIARPQRLEQQYEFLRAHPGIGLLGTGMELTTPDGKTLDQYEPPTEDANIRSAMLHSNPLRHPTILMRKELVVAVGGYRKAFVDADDYDLWLRLAECTRLANLPHPLVRYRLHANQATTRNMTHQVLCACVARVAAARRKAGLSDSIGAAQEITPEFARSLGVHLEDVYREAASGILDWAKLFAGFDTDSALQMLESVEEMRRSSLVPRSSSAEGLMRAAGIRLRKRQFGKAIRSAGQAVLIQPVRTARIAKMAIARRLRDWRRKELLWGA